VIVGWNWE